MNNLTRIITQLSEIQTIANNLQTEYDHEDAYFEETSSNDDGNEIYPETFDDDSSESQGRNRSDELIQLNDVFSSIHILKQDLKQMLDMNKGNLSTDSYEIMQNKINDLRAMLEDISGYNFDQLKHSKLHNSSNIE